MTICQPKFNETSLFYHHQPKVLMPKDILENKKLGNQIDKGVEEDKIVVEELFTYLCFCKDCYFCLWDQLFGYHRTLILYHLLMLSRQLYTWRLGVIKNLIYID